MKKLLITAAAAALAITTAPAYANSSWVSIGNSVSGNRHYVQKHNWQGRYRVYGSISIGSDNEKLQSVQVADCGSWAWRLSGYTQWKPALPDTMVDAELRYVCS